MTSGQPEPFRRLRDVGNRLQIGGDILADGAVAARCTLHEHAVLVTERSRQPIDLRLRREQDFSQFLRVTKKPPKSLEEIGHILVRIGLGKAEHGHRMAHLGKAFGRRRADPLRRRIVAHEVGKTLLDGEVAPAQGIVVGIGNRRCVFGVIAAVVLGDLFGQAREFGRRLLLGQLLDGFGGKRHRNGRTLDLRRDRIVQSCLGK